MIKTLRIPIEVDVQDLVEQLSRDLDHADLLELIKMIDKAQADYDFTEELRDYFVSEIEKEDAIVDEKE